MNRFARLSIAAFVFATGCGDDGLTMAPIDADLSDVVPDGALGDSMAIYDTVPLPSDVVSAGDAAPAEESQPDVLALDAAPADLPTLDATDSGAGDAADGALDAGDGAVAPAAEWVGIVGTGQSLSVGASAGRVINSRARYNNLKLADTGSVPRYDGTGDRLALVPLVEPIRSGLSGAGYPGPPLYPTNIAGETPHTSMADQVTAMSRALRGTDFLTVHSVVGESGRSITSIERMGTGRAYAATLYEGRAITEIARAAGRRFTFGAVVLTHGETDTARTSYEADIYRLLTDYNRDLSGITGQATRIPMLLSQQSTFPGAAGGRSVSTQLQWRAGVDHPGEIVCVGPKYQYEYSPDHVHFDAYGYQRLGIKYAQVFYEIAVMRRAWRPLEPTAVRRAGRVITVDFHVPVGPLAWEETLSPPHQGALTEWSAARGFEVESAAGRQRIESVRIVGASVEITLVAPPTGAAVVVRYAMTQDAAGYAGGLATGRRGQLRDSDPFVGIDRESVVGRFTRGSATVTGRGPTAFAQRGVRDRAEASGIAAGAVVVGRTDAALTLSQPWTGATGEAPLTLYSDQRNYCVQFEFAVP